MHLAKKYEPHEIPRHFRDLAFAYLESSERLCQDMESGEWAPDYNKGQVAMLLAFHATELFLKGCIRAAARGPMKNLHSLGQLLNEFSELFPNLKFEPPFGPEPVPADPDAIEWALRTDATLHQQLRYPTDTSGQPWKGERSFSPSLFQAELARLRNDFVRIDSAVFK